MAPREATDRRKRNYLLLDCRLNGLPPSGSPGHKNAKKIQKYRLDKSEISLFIDEIDVMLTCSVKARALLSTSYTNYSVSP